MIEAIVRPAYQAVFVDPFARWLGYSLSANAITLSAGLFGIFVPIALLYGHPYLAVLTLIFSGYCDCLDGTLARMQKNCSAFGTVLDISVDRLVEFLVVYSLYLVSPFERGGYCLWMLGCILLCVTSFLVVGIFSDNDSNKSFYYSPGLMERPEAFLFFIAMMLLPQWFSALATSFCALVLLTAVFRLYQFYCQILPK